MRFTDREVTYPESQCISVWSRSPQEGESRHPFQILTLLGLVCGQTTKAHIQVRGAEGASGFSHQRRGGFLMTARGPDRMVSRGGGPRRWTASVASTEDRPTRRRFSRREATRGSGNCQENSRP